MLPSILILFASLIINIFTIIFYRKQLEEASFTFQNEIADLQNELKTERRINHQLMRHVD